MKKLLDAHAKTAEERQALSERLEREALERRKIEKTKGMLLGKLQAMEAKLIQARAKAPGEKGDKEELHLLASPCLLNRPPRHCCRYLYGIPYLCRLANHVK